MSNRITVEVVYAERDHQELLSLELPAGSRVSDAVERAQLQTVFPALEISAERVGVFGRKVPMTQLLRDGDRVEIYRPLIADPKAVRRARAEAAKAALQGDEE